MFRLNWVKESLTPATIKTKRAFDDLHIDQNLLQSTEKPGQAPGKTKSNIFEDHHSIYLFYYHFAIEIKYANKIHKGKMCLYQEK